MALSLRQAMHFNWKLTQDRRNLSPVPRSSSGPHFSPLLPTLKFEVSSQSLAGDVISPKAFKPSNDEHSQRYIPNPDICPKCQACIFHSHVARVSPILYKACLPHFRKRHHSSPCSTSRPRSHYSHFPSLAKSNPTPNPIAFISKIYRVYL